MTVELDRVAPAVALDPAHRWRRRVPGGRVARSIVLGGALALGLLGVWHLALVVFDVPTYEVPTPWTAISAIGSNAGEIASHLWVTLQGAALGLAAAVVVAAVLALVAIRWPHLEQLLLAYAIVVRTIPIVGVAPTVTLVFGRGLVTSVICVMVVATFPLLISILNGQRALPPEMHELFGVYDATFRDQVRRGLAPAAVGAVLVGLRTAAPFAVLGALLAEWLTGIGGLGTLMVTAATNRLIPLLWAAALVTALFGLVVYGAVGLAERWARHQGLETE
jgi:ABC-type nitrate/sulfonate/bicarbonate transport system permease component